MIPLCLVTGFLGSGKTTFLQRIVETHRHRKFIYLINEFAPVDIDGSVLALPDGEQIGIVGGSIFCRCLVHEFIRVLRSIREQFHSPANQFEGVVIESSGIANPKVIQQLLLESQLDREYQIYHILSVIDPGSFLKLIHTLPVVIQQVESSDILLLNKIDVYAPDMLDRVEMQLRSIHPQARIERTRYCQIDIDLFTPASRETLQGEYALCSDPHYFQTVMRSSKPIDWLRLKSALISTQSDMYRVKGFVRTIENLLYVDYSSSGWREEILPPHPNLQGTELVLIVRGKDQILADTLQARVQKGEFDTG